jgi:3-oxoacyl-[acyl-carrier protein] reductase
VIGDRLRLDARTVVVAGAVVSLLGDLSSFVTGQVLPLDGGSTVRPSYLGSDDIPVFMEDGPIRDRLLDGA